jgi:hypothetical protein
VPLLALLGAALEGPAQPVGLQSRLVDFERADLLEPAGEGSNLASRISCSGQFPGAVLNPYRSLAARCWPIWSYITARLR